MNLLKSIFSKHQSNDLMQNAVIANGRIQAHNSVLVLDVPTDIQGEAVVNGPRLVKILQQCGDASEIKITDKRLTWSKGKLKAYLPLIEGDAFKATLLESDKYQAKINLPELFAKLKPFMGNEQGPYWANGIEFKGAQLSATNTTTFVMAEVDNDFPQFILPRATVEMIISIKEQPSALLINEFEVTFKYESGMWLQSRVLDARFPVLNRKLDLDRLKPLPDELSNDLQSLSKLAGKDAIIKLSPGHAETEGAEIACSYDGPECSLVFSPLLDVLPLAKEINFEGRVVVWRGDNLIGAVAKYAST